jgi:hypothetical protein
MVFVCVSPTYPQKICEPDERRMLLATLIFCQTVERHESLQLIMHNIRKGGLPTCHAFRTRKEICTFVHAR